MIQTLQPFFTASGKEWKRESFSFAVDTKLDSSVGSALKRKV